MEELASTVSDILNQAAGGVGDISSWLATNGLPSYARVMLARNGVYVVIQLLVAFVCVSFGVAERKIAHRYDEELYFFLFLFVLIDLITMLFTIPDFVGWLVAPDGMLLNTLLSSFAA